MEPGERLDERAPPIIDYLTVFYCGEAEVQGVCREKQPDGSTRIGQNVTG
jgi:hypothetical protein